MSHKPEPPNISATHFELDALISIGQSIYRAEDGAMGLAFKALQRPKAIIEQMIGEATRANPRVGIGRAAVLLFSQSEADVDLGWVLSRELFDVYPDVVLGFMAAYGNRAWDALHYEFIEAGDRYPLTGEQRDFLMTEVEALGEVWGEEP